MYCEEDKKSPIAKFIKPQRVPSPPGTSRHEQQWTPAQLVVDARGEEILDIVVISFLVLEKTRRHHENSTDNRADVLGYPEFNVLRRG